MERVGMTASSSIGSRGGRWSGRGRCGEIRGSGQSFYRWPRREEEEVASTGEACCGGDDGTQWWHQDGSGQAVAMGRLGHSARGCKTPIRARERVNGEETGRAVADDERVDGRSRAREKEADEWGPPARERAVAREKGRVRLTGGAELLGERARGMDREGGRSVGARERGGSLGRIRPSREGRVFFFLFFFSLFSLISFSFKQIFI
jgi:hypothetical protein